MHAEFAKAVHERRKFVRLVTGRAPRRRGSGKRLAIQKQPDAIRLAYFTDLIRRVLHPAHALVKARLVPQLADLVSARGDARADAKPKKVNQIIKEISTEFHGNFGQAGAEELAGRYADATSDLQRNELARQLRSAVGVEVPINDAKVGPQIEHFTATNVSLIRTIPERYFSQVEQKVLEGIGAGSRWEDIADQLERRFEVSQNVAKVIARDQVGKFYADLNKTRQENLGITHWYWMTAADERTCPICAPLNGKRFSWANPPPEGEPGDVHPQCRCSSNPDTDELVDSLE